MAKKKTVSRPIVENQSEPQRLHKVLASAGLASRRDCEEYIRTGRICVDGHVVTELGLKVDPATQKITVDGEKIRIEQRQYFLVHKPTGVLCTNSDPAGRPRVIDMLPPMACRLFTIGRLDETSEGLILVTNDGDLAHRMAHPSFRVERVYRALVAGDPQPDVFAQLRRGEHFSEGRFHVDEVRKVKNHGQATIIELTLHEGQNREIRRLLARVGHKVLRLKRVAFGPIRLGDLEKGESRPLFDEEIEKLRRFVRGEDRHKKARTFKTPAKSPRKRSPHADVPPTTTTGRRPAMRRKTAADSAKPQGGRPAAKPPGRPTGKLTRKATRRPRRPQ